MKHNALQEIQMKDFIEISNDDIPGVLFVSIN